MKSLILLFALSAAPALADSLPPSPEQLLAANGAEKEKVQRDHESFRQNIDMVNSAASAGAYSGLGFTVFGWQAIDLAQDPRIGKLYDKAESELQELHRRKSFGGLTPEQKTALEQRIQRKGVAVSRLEKLKASQLAKTDRLKVRTGKLGLGLVALSTIAYIHGLHADHAHRRYTQKKLEALEGDAVILRQLLESEHKRSPASGRAEQADAELAQ